MERFIMKNYVLVEGYARGAVAEKAAEMLNIPIYYMGGTEF